ncbi:MAG TPA: HprK-related kinase A [Casimicrobiaceae bacterium]|nr:HprK-related kinase A [Casimicrobiaceae bacterium]
MRVGPIVARIRSPFRVVELALRLHYAADALAPDDDFVDFDVTVDAPIGVRRYVRPQAVFRFEGREPFKPLPASQAFPLLEWGLNWCISAHCHQYLIVHAAVVERSGRAVLMPAPPGSGKSTLCAALVARGFRLLSDELALIDIATGRLVPLPRPISLKNASIGIIQSFWKDGTIGAVVHDTVKGAVAHASAPRDSVARSTEHASPAFVVVPRYRADSEITLDPLSRAAGFMQLADNAFNYSLHGRAGFDALARLIDGSACFAFTYGGPLDDAVRAIEALYER